MLIPSRRHTPEDLAIWAELEAADLVHGQQLADESPQVRRSIEAIQAFAEGGRCYCGVSWGKDSVVVADLVARFSPTIPLVWVVVSPIANPDCWHVRDAFLRRYPDQPYVEILLRCRWSGGEWHASGTLEQGFRRAAEMFGDRHISGVRADESTARTLRMRRWGLATSRTLCPLGWWTTADVFGYLARRGLPVHPAYAMTGGGRWPREHLRVASLGGRRGDGHGRARWEWEYYADTIQRSSFGE